MQALCSSCWSPSAFTLLAVIDGSFACMSESGVGPLYWGFDVSSLQGTFQALVRGIFVFRWVSLSRQEKTGKS